MRVAAIGREALSAAVALPMRGRFVVVGVDFDLDRERSHDLIADRVVSAAYGRGETVAWYVSDSSSGVHLERLRSACGRAGGVAESFGSWQAVAECVRLHEFASLKSGALNVDVVLIEGLPLGTPGERQEGLSAIERQSAPCALLLDAAAADLETAGDVPRAPSGMVA